MNEIFYSPTLLFEKISIDPMLKHQSCIHLWIPNMFEFKGGIQVYSAFLLDALQQLKLNVDYDVFLKHDTQTTGDVPARANTRFHFAGSYPLPVRTAAFASQILAQGVFQKPQLVISTHINFAPAAYRLKQLTGIPYWAVAHGIDAWNLQQPAIQRALHHADLILPVGGYTRDRLIEEQHLDPTRLAIVLHPHFANECNYESGENLVSSKLCSIAIPKPLKD